MKKLLMIALCITLSFPINAFAGAYGLEDLSERLARQARNFAEQTSRDYSYRNRPDRSEVETLYQSQMFLAGAELFSRMVRERRSESELRDALAYLNAQARSSGNGWRNIQETLNDIGRELRTNNYDYNGGNNGGGNGRDDSPERIIGRLNWKGTVDNEVYLYIRDAQVTIQNVSGAPFANQQFNFTSAFPRRNVMAQLLRKRGRGRVEIIQQPSRSNDFTAIVRILDRDGGAANYEFEMAW